MSLIFYYAPMSTAVTTHWVLEELAIPYDRVTIDLKTGEQHKPEHLARDPNGRVPVLVHDGTPIFESAAIAIHLGETYGVAKRLFPEPGLRRAEALKWIVWSSVTLGEAWARYQHSSSPRVPAERHNAAAAEAARADVDKALGILDGALAGRTWLVGDTFSLVDAHVGCWLAYLAMCGVDTKPWAKLDAWLERCRARPAFKLAMDR